MVFGLRPVLLIVIVGLLARGAAMVALRSQLREDPDAYGIIATNLAHHGCYCLSAGRPTAFRPPLYPLLLAPWSFGERPAIAGVVALHLLLSAMTIFGMYVLGLGCGSQRSALIAATITAFDPLLVHQSTLLMTETLAASLTVIALLAVQRMETLPTRGSVLIAGMSLGFAALCRPTFLFWVPLVALGVLLKRGEWSRRLRVAGGFVTAVILVLMPWAVRNWMVLGAPVLATTHGGYTIWLANNNSFYDYLAGEQPGPWLASELDEQQKSIFREMDFNERAADRRYQELAFDTMRERPGMLAYSCLWRVAKLWHPVPEPRSQPESWAARGVRALVGLWYLGIYAAAVTGLWRHYRRLGRAPLWPALALCFAFTLVHAIYWSNIRMRAPLVPALALFASLTASTGLCPEKAKDA